MKIIVYRGTNQIGGTIIELSSKNTRIIFDVGEVLPTVSKYKRSKPVNRPSVAGLFNEDENNIDGVFLSHGHGDHIGLLPFINASIPIFIGEKTCAVYNMISRFTGANFFVRPSTFLEHTKPIIIGNFTVIPYLIDHSSYDAYAFIIYCEGKSVVYTGDIREHGSKASLTRLFRRNLPIKIDALIMEGTMLGRLDDESQTEKDIQFKATLFMKKIEGPILVLQSTVNIDRLVAMYHAAKKSGRLFVIDIFTANILDVIGGSVSNIIRKSRVIYLNPMTDKMFKIYNEGALMNKFVHQKIQIAELNQLTNYCMLIRASMLGILKNLNTTGGGFIYSKWSGYADSDNVERVLQYAKKNNMEVVSLHTSGHGDLSSLKKIAANCTPKRVIPIHTEYPERFKDSFDSVCIITQVWRKNFPGLSPARL